MPRYGAGRRLVEKACLRESESRRANSRINGKIFLRYLYNREFTHNHTQLALQSGKQAERIHHQRQSPKFYS
jgi:hypothetical protein